MILQVWCRHLTLPSNADPIVAQIRRHREAAVAYERHRRYLDDQGKEEAEPKLTALREQVMNELQRLKASVGLADEQQDLIRRVLINVVAEDSPYPSKKALLDAVLGVINAARTVKYVDRPRYAIPWMNLDQASDLKAALDTYGDVVGLHLRRQSELRLQYRATRAVMEDFGAWRSLIQETALGSRTEDQHADEFALQATYSKPTQVVESGGLKPPTLGCEACFRRLI